MAQSTSSTSKASGTSNLVRGLGILTTFALVVQFSMAGLGAFLGRHDAADHASDYDPHKMLGYLIAALTVLLLLSVVLARLGQRTVLLSVLLVVLAGPLQPLLAGLGTDSAAVWGAFHALNGLIILGVTATILRASRPS